MVDKFDLKDAYRKLVIRVKGRVPTEKAAMERAIGGHFEAFGIIEREMLRYYGLTERSYLIDVGCGSGRLAKPLSAFAEMRYLGTDIVPELIAFCRKTIARPDWNFTVVDKLEIPEGRDKADMVCFFSVLTHLLHEQSYIYLEEARRVLKPGGTIVLSFLEFRMKFQWSIFAATVKDARGSNLHPLNVFIERDALAVWAAHLGLEVVDTRNGDEPFVPLDAPLRLEDGRVMNQFGCLGQSICVLRKPR